MTAAQAAPNVVSVAPAPAVTKANAEAKPVSDKSQSLPWAALTVAQQTALRPLAANWPAISAGQKRKWLELSRGYPGMSPSEQAKMHSRMTDWVALSAQDRAQARLNFAQARQLTPEDKKAKWQAYQALSPEERERLAKDAAPKRTSVAAAVKPVPAHKLTTVPTSRNHLQASNALDGKHASTPKIAAAPHQVDSNTLLPQQTQIAAPLAAPPTAALAQPLVAPPAAPVVAPGISR